MEILFQSMTAVLLLLMCVWFAMCIRNEIARRDQLKRLDEAANAVCLKALEMLEEGKEEGR